jgi:hypothetical protein
MRKQGFHFQSDVSRFYLQVGRISISLSDARTIEPSSPDTQMSIVPSIQTMCHSVRMPHSPASSVWTTCSFRPDPYIVSRSFCSSLLRPDVSATRPDTYQFSNGSLILSKFQEREDQSTVRTMWYPVRTRVSLRQESQFKIDCPDVWQLCSGRWCIVYGNCRFDFNGPDVCPSWFGRTHIRYGNCVLKFGRSDAHPLWSGRAKPIMEITCSGRVTVQTIKPSRSDEVLIQERFLRKFFRKSCRTVVHPDDPCPPSERLLGIFCLTPILYPSL